MVMKQNPSNSPSARRSSLRALALAAAGLWLVSCGGGGGNDDGNSNDPSVWHFRGVNAISDAPQVQFYIDDTAVATAEYGAATDYKPAHTGERPLKVAVRNASKLETADPGYTDIGTEESYDFQGPTDYTLVVAGTVANPSQFVITDTSREDVADNKVEYQVINAATAAGALDVYITAPGASIDAPQLVDQLAVGEYSAKTNLDLEVASGAGADDARSTNVIFQVRSGATVLYGSSSFSVAEKSRLLVVIADNDGPVGAAPVKLLVLGGIAAGSASVMLNTGDPAELRFANVSQEAGAIDLIVGSSAADIFAPNVVFGASSGYLTRPADTYNSIATPTGNDGVFLFVNSLALSGGRSYTLYGQGLLSDMRGVPLTDDRRSVPTEARFRFFYAAAGESGYTLDVYLTKRGAALDLGASTPPTPNVSSLAYRGASSQLVLDGGSYDVYFTRAGVKTVLLGPLPLDLADGSLQTLVLADGAGSGSQLIAYDDARH